MCAHYESVSEKARLKTHFGTDLPGELARRDVWPGYLSSFIRRHPHADVGDDAVPPREALLGSFGLIPHWSKDGKVRNTFNARSETVDTKPSFRDAWSRSQRCIIPASRVFEPDWRSGRAVSMGFSRRDGRPMALAGLWSRWQSGGQSVVSYTMLTINADDHALMRHMHKPDEEKRMVVVLHENMTNAWLSASPQDAVRFMQAFPAEQLHMEPLEPVPPSLF